MDLKAVKITNPHYLQNIAGEIDEFAKKLKIPGLYGQTLAAYFMNSVQFGGSIMEFWVVMAEDRPVALAHWFAKSLPFTGAVSIDFLHSWAKDDKATDLLFDKLHDFAIRMKAKYVYAGVIKDSLVRYCKKRAEQRNCEFYEAPFKNFMLTIK